ncbi:MFS transporter [Staphylococcus canis]|uniref:MFS transporter n=1 Tax=Staphylococcus canis TaxID=2724942 RepID=UPI0032E80133
MSTKGERLFTKDYIVNFSVSFSIYLAMYLLIVVIAKYTIDVYHVSESIAGLVSGIFIVGALVGRFVTGRLIDIVGPKKILLLGTFFFIVTQCFYFIEGSLIFLIITRFLNGIFMAVATTATGTIVAMIAPQSRRAEGISLFSLSLVLGAAIGPFLGLYLSNHYSAFVLFMVCVVIAVMALVLAIFVHVEFEAKPMRAEDKSFHISQFISTPAIPIAIVVLICGLGYASVLSFIQIYANFLDLAQVASYYFICYAIASIVTRPFVGRLMDRYHENVVAYPVLFIFGVGLLVLAMTSSGWMLLLSGALLGIGYGSMTAVGNVAAVKVSDRDKVSLATSTFFIGLDVGIGFGPSLLGLITPIVGYRMMYIIVGFCLFFAILLYWFVHGRYRHQHQM